MKKIKNFFVLLCIFINSFMHGADWSKLLYSSAAIEESNLVYRLDQLDLTSYKYGWLPAISLYEDFTRQKNSYNDKVRNSLYTSLKISQDIPGGFVLWGGLTLPFLSYEGMFTDDDWSNSINPGIGLDIPLIPSVCISKSYKELLCNKYSLYKNNSDIDYKIDFKQKASVFCDSVWKVLYNRKKIELLCEQYNLLKEVEKDSLTLFEQGRINLVELEERASETQNVLLEIIDARSTLLKAQKKLVYTGFDIEENDIEIEGFLEWLKDFSSLYMQFEDLTRQKEINTLKINFLKSVTSRTSSFPVFRTSFDWTKNTWDLNLSVSLKLFPNPIDISEINAIKLEKRLYQMRLNNIDNSSSSFSKLWKVQKDLNNSNIDLIQAEVEMEENRLNAYQELYKCGRVNEITVKIQQNKLLQVRLLFQNAQVELYKGYLSFY